jgi:hypothetical protein
MFEAIKELNVLKTVEWAPRSPNYMPLEDAILYCRFCNHGGHNDWRFPLRLEDGYHAELEDYWCAEDLNEPERRWGWGYVRPVRDV